jgi:hypothetical protein
MRAIYVPVFDRFFESSIMQEALPVRFVMLALIRLAWRSGANGEVDVDLRTFAGSLNLPFTDVEAAVQRLMEPDPSSHSPDEDGRRLVPLDPDRPMRGWRLVNWQKYRVLLNRTNDAARKRDEYHAEKDNSKSSESLQDSPEVSGFRDNLVTRRDETIRDEVKEKRERVVFVPPTVEEMAGYISEKGYPLDAEAIHAHYVANGWVQASGRPIKDWKAAVVTCAKRPRFDAPTKQEPAVQHDERTAARKADADKWAEMQATVAKELAEDAAERKAHGL